MSNYQDEFEKWFLSLDSDFGQEELVKFPNGKYFYTTTRALYDLFCQVRGLEQDAERYRFIRDTDNWGEDSPNENRDTWDDLTEAHCQEFDRIVDSRMQKEL